MLDETRASDAQRKSIVTAKAEASAVAMEDLLEATNSFDQTTATPQQHESLRDLRAVLLRHGVVAEPSLEQQSALEIASKATAVLEQSDQRIATMNSVTASFRTAGPAVQCGLVMDALGAITPFDQKLSLIHISEPTRPY